MDGVSVSIHSRNKQREKEGGREGGGGEGVDESYKRILHATDR